MKFFIINSFRFIVYLAYFAIIAIQTFGFYLERVKVGQIVHDLTGTTLQDSAQTGLAIISGLIWGWLSATIICGILVTLLDIRDDINDRLPNARAK
jgi:hypothetical protein